MTAVTSLFLLAFIGHFVLILAIYVSLGIARAGDVRAGTTTIDSYVRADADGPGSDRVKRNLANQFELPMFAYFAAAVLIGLGVVGWYDVLAGWLFLAGRVLHTLVQTRTTNVALRGRVFLLTVVAVILLMGHLLALTLGLDLP